MRVYHFINEKYGLEALHKETLKIARIRSLNDPFEGLHLGTENYLIRETLKDRINRANRRHGILCFSENFSNPVQWAHYADSHKGLCLGFDMPEENFIKIKYINEREMGRSFVDALDYKGKDFIKHILSKKFCHWEYEQEHRIIIDFPETYGSELKFEPFSSEMRLSEIIIGCRSQLSPKALKKIFGQKYPETSITKVAPSFDEFKMVRLSDLLPHY